MIKNLLIDNDIFSPLLTELWNDSFFTFEDEKEHMKVDILELEDKYILYADLPGVDKKDIELTLTNESILNIEVKHKESLKEKFLRKERKNLMKRSFAFEDINTDEVEATVELGILTVTIPKEVCYSQAEKRIQINP